MSEVDNESLNVSISTYVKASFSFTDSTFWLNNLSVYIVTSFAAIPLGRHDIIYKHLILSEKLPKQALLKDKIFIPIGNHKMLKVCVVGIMFFKNIVKYKLKQGLLNKIF